MTKTEVRSLLRVRSTLSGPAKGLVTKKLLKQADKWCEDYYSEGWIGSCKGCNLIDKLYNSIRRDNN